MQRVRRKQLGAPDVKTILTRQRGRCAGCFGVLRHPPQIDHVLPLSSGGSHTSDNLQALCVQCHALKTCAEQRADSLSAAAMSTARAFDARAADEARAEVQDALGFLEPHAPELAAASRAALDKLIAAHLDQWRHLRQRVARGSIVVCAVCGAVTSAHSCFPAHRCTAKNAMS